LFLSRLFRPRAAPDSARRLYDAIVAQARQPAFYAELGVPDTLDGRFDLIALHAFLLLRRLKEDAGARDLAREVVEVMIADLDASLREMGAGDLGVGRRVKRMGEALYGRIAAYDAGMAAGPAALEAALRRNLYGTAEAAAGAAPAVAAYVMSCVNYLKNQDIHEIASGVLAFPPGPGAPLAGPGRH
jgi:cytochrome b pre-mRNA-processing protein 3